MGVRGQRGRKLSPPAFMQDSSSDPSTRQPAFSSDVEMTLDTSGSSPVELAPDEARLSNATRSGVEGRLHLGLGWT